MSYLRAPFVAGFLLHIVLVVSRVQFLDLACAGRDCSPLIWADLPLSVIYLAFPDGALIVASLLLGSVLWGLWGLGLHRLLRLIFRE